MYYKTIFSKSVWSLNWFDPPPPPLLFPPLSPLVAWRSENWLVFRWPSDTESRIREKIWRGGGFLNIFGVHLEESIYWELSTYWIHAHFMRFRVRIQIKQSIPIRIRIKIKSECESRSRFLKRQLWVDFWAFSFLNIWIHNLKRNGSRDKMNADPDPDVSNRIN